MTSLDFFVVAVVQRDRADQFIKFVDGYEFSDYVARMRRVGHCVQRPFAFV